MPMPALKNEIGDRTTAESATSPRVRAQLQLEFLRDTGSRASFLAQSYQEPPFKVVRSFPLPDGSAMAHLHNVSGGLLGGDHLTQRISVGNRATVQLTTTGATRIYRPRPEAMPTVQRTVITIGEEALLEYLPDATIPYAGSRYLQRTSIQLGPGAGLFWWEILAPGREARGELFAYEDLEVRTRISAGGAILAAENLLLKPSTGNVKSLARLGPYRYLATFYICQTGLAPRAWQAAEDHLRELTGSLTRSGELLWGVSSLVAHGVVVRCLARHGREILPGLHAIWRRAKLHLYDREAIPPRKVN